MSLESGINKGLEGVTRRGASLSDGLLVPAAEIVRSGALKNADLCSDKVCAYSNTSKRSRTRHPNFRRRHRLFLYEPGALATCRRLTKLQTSESLECTN